MDARRRAPPVSIALRVRTLHGRPRPTRWRPGDPRDERAIPSPWRILRALALAGTRLDPPAPTAALRHLLLDTLAPPPHYHVPPVTVPAEPREIVVTWPDVELPPSQCPLLDLLLDALGCLDPDQTWLEARLAEPPASPFDAWPLAPGGTTTTARRSRLALMSEQEWALWRDAVTPRLARRSAPELPVDRWAALTLPIERLQSDGWWNPPGAKAVDYAFRGVAAPEQGDSRASRATVDPSVAVFALRCAELPLLTRALEIGDIFRKALMAWSRDEDGLSHPVFTGRDRLGRPRADQHRHAHQLCLDIDGDGRIDHLLVWAPEGLDEDACRALRRGDRLWGPEGLRLSLELVGLEQAAALDAGANCRWPPLACVRDWVSSTPFVLMRHPKRRRSGEPKHDARGMWIDGPRWQLLTELRRRGLPEPREMHELERTSLGEGAVPWTDFSTRRPGGGRRYGAPTGFALRFEEPITGPLALGFGAHQGLGLFLPAGGDGQ